jgi:hypothetical protein
VFARNTHALLALAVIDTVMCGHLRDMLVSVRVNVESIAMGLTHQYCRRVEYSDEMELPEIHCTEGNRQGDVHEEMLDTIIRVGQLKVEIIHEKKQTIPGPVKA